jgi:hypothetical protein
MPESPRWLLRKGRREDTRHAFAKLGIDVSLDNLERTAHALDQTDREASRRTTWTAGARRALMVACVFFVFQHITGINVPLCYGPHLLRPGSGGQVASTVAGTALLTVVNVARTCPAFRYVDRIGRRKLSISGYAGMIVFALVAAVGLPALHGTARIIVTMIGSFAPGVGGTGWLPQGEVFATSVRGRAASLAASVNWISNLALVEVFPVWQAGIGLGWVMVCPAATKPVPRRSR